MNTIQYNIANTNVRGKIRISDTMTYNDALNIIKKKHSLISECTIIYKGCLLILDNIIDSSYTHIIIISDDIQKNINSDKKIPDYNNYKLSIIRLQNFNKSGSKKEIHIIKIIKKYGNSVIIKLFKRTQLNYGCSPTLYALLNIKKNILSPIYILNDKFEEFIASGYMRYINQYPGIKIPYETVELNECIICMDNIANVFTYCKCNNVFVCSDCTEKITKCPTCSTHIYSVEPIITL